MLCPGIHEEAILLLCPGIHEEAIILLCPGIHEEAILLLCPGIHEEGILLLCPGIHEEAILLLSSIGSWTQLVKCEIWRFKVINLRLIWAFEVFMCTEMSGSPIFINR